MSSKETNKTCADCLYFNGANHMCISRNVRVEGDACDDFADKEKLRVEAIRQRIGIDGQSPEHDSVEHPAHYTSGGIECIDCIKAALGENFIGFLIGNVIKYVYRYKSKNGVEDLKKAAKYLEWAIQELKNNENV